MTKRLTSAGLVLCCALLVGIPALADGEKVMVYKSPTCGCCGKWIEHLEAHGFEVDAENTSGMDAIKDGNSIPRRMRSCHTAFVEGYVIEGHVPAEDVKRLLLERPQVAGLAVPDMPIGSPGMEGPKPEPYDVLSFGGGKGTAVFSSHDPRKSQPAD
jgi:hypothetical protein